MAFSTRIARIIRGGGTSYLSVIDMTDSTNVDVRLCALVGSVCAVDLVEPSSGLALQSRLKRTGSPQPVARGPQKRRD